MTQILTKPGTYRTRSGKEVKILTVDDSTHATGCKGVKPDGTTGYWYASGKYYAQDFIHSLDIVETVL